MAFVPTFPLHLLRPKAIEFGWTGSSIAAGRAVSGAYTALEFGGGGYLVYSYQEIPYQTPEEHRAMARVAAILRGSINPILVPILSQWTGPFPRNRFGYPQDVVEVPHSDGSTFSDGSVYQQSTVSAKAASASSSADPTALSIVVTAGGKLYGGEWFGIAHPTRGHRAYLIQEIEGEETTSQGVVYHVLADRPLREVVAADDAVEFRMPLCKMKLEMGADLRPNAAGRWLGSTTITFQESE